MKPQTGLDRVLLKWFAKYGTIKAVGILIPAIILTFKVGRWAEGAVRDQLQLRATITETRLALIEKDRKDSIRWVAFTNRFEVKDRKDSARWSENLSQHRTLFKNDSIIKANQSKKYEIVYLPQGNIKVREEDLKKND